MKNKHLMWKLKKIALDFKKTRPIIYDYLKYKYQFLNSFYNRSFFLKTVISFIIVSAIILILYYTFYCEPLTKNGVLDAVLATPLQIVIILSGLVIILTFRVIGYKGTTGINKDHNFADAQCKQNIKGFLYIPLYMYKDLILDTKELINLQEMHPIVSAILRFTIIDKGDLYRLEAGPLDIPKATLRSIEGYDDKVIISLGSISYYDIFFTHYFADYHLSSQSFEENQDHKITLRSILGNKCMDYTCKSTTNFDIGKKFIPFPILPNPLGVTGICRFSYDNKYFLIQRKRGKNVINEVNKIDWSFSGLIEAHTLYDDQNELNIKEYFQSELIDELISQIEDKYVQIISYLCLGIIFSARYLYQPEMIMLINLDIKVEGIKKLKKNLSYVVREEDEVLAEQISECNHKDLFVPVLELYKQYLKSEYCN